LGEEEPQEIPVLEEREVGDVLAVGLQELQFRTFLWSLLDPCLP
jgi:hypothetical protein